MKKVEQFIEFSNDATMTYCVSRRCGLMRLPVQLANAITFVEMTFRSILNCMMLVSQFHVALFRTYQSKTASDSFQV